jgi:hypothetical protein
VCITKFSRREIELTTFVRNMGIGWAAMTFHDFGEWLEMWTTVIVNLTAIITGLIVATKWIVRRAEPTLRSLASSALVGLVASILGVVAAGVIASSEIWIAIHRLFTH